MTYHLNIQWPAPGIAAATFYVSAWYCPRWVDDQLSSLTFGWRRQLQIWPDRILPVLYLLNLLNTLIFWVTFPLHLASFSQDEEPGLRDYEVPLAVHCLPLGDFSTLWSWYELITKRGFCGFVMAERLSGRFLLRRPSWDCWTSCVMERASGPFLARLTECTLRNSTVSEYGMIWQLIQFD